MNRLKTKFADQAGVSLLEVMISMIILSVALLVLLNLAMVALDSNDWSKNATSATQLMQQKLEEVRSTAPSSGSYVDTVGEYQRNWTVSNFASHLDKVDIKIAWTDVRGKTKVDSMTTLVRTP
ncbi:MAG: prepilin-type N-terminal cleavage/methylation domain-containing protein [bacterium]